MVLTLIGLVFAAHLPDLAWIRDIEDGDIHVGLEPHAT